VEVVEEFVAQVKVMGKNLLGKSKLQKLLEERFDLVLEGLGQESWVLEFIN